MSLGSSGPSVSRPAERKQTPPRKIWMLTYECAGLAWVGGLGEAVEGLAGTLARDYHLEITVFLPSHGKHTDETVRESYSLEEERTFIARGSRRGVNGFDYPYLAGAEKGSKESVSYVLVKGLDVPTGNRLNSGVLYDHDVTLEKMALFSRTLKTYANYLLAIGRRNELPDLVHAHDWHMVPAAVALIQVLEARGLAVPLTFTVHLLGHVSLPWHYGSDEWCGIRDGQHLVRIGKRFKTLSYRQVWEEQSKASLETFGCYEADYVTSVSDSYLNNDVRNYVGEVIEGKSGRIYNGCDWNYSQIQSNFLEQKEELALPQPTNAHPNRWDLRKYLLTRGLGQAKPIAGQEDTQATLTRQDDPQHIEPFRQDGPLVLMTGRLSPQKGVDVLLDSIPLVLKTLPDTRFLLFLLPPDDSTLVRETSTRAAKHRNNVRLILGRERTIYPLSHIAADVYAMPSRSEPFGISALEAMATGNPVVGSRVGGIQETVLDLPEHGESGTGILAPTETVESLAASLASMLLVMMIDEFSQRKNGNVANLIRKIPLKPIREMVSKNPLLGSRIRENCRIRVEENFRWKNAGLMALDRYSVAAGFSAKRVRRLESQRSNLFATMKAGLT